MVGDVVSRWPVVRLENISSLITKGTTPTTLGFQFNSEGVPFLRAEDVQGRAVDWRNVTYHIDDNCNQALSRSQLVPGDLLVTIAGTVGRVGYVPDDAPTLNCNQAVCVVRIDPAQLDLQFACYAMQSPLVKTHLRSQGTQATVTNLSLKQIRELPIPLPLSPNSAASSTSSTTPPVSATCAARRWRPPAS